MMQETGVCFQEQDKGRTIQSDYHQEVVAECPHTLDSFEKSIA
jgi:hypothetical protein